ncbi:sulfurtransferase complex subunit TusD [Cellvibrio sp. OA-2007]|uniref:sulfurtransferase complex subunit TusD n=1 Tax=Cellvibrio sp. OA-2007 TaxID=529823 RepID=UPI0007848AA9|nr:sulfurtransferase complex subunit TusD [Cellvibrio sp. OA-2007]
MIFSLAVYAAPYSSQASYSAYKFAMATLEQGHKLHRIFFYQDGAHNATNLASPPQDEFNLQQAWQSLAKDHNLDLVVCIAAALRRGVLNESEAKRYNKPSHNLADEFTISGLGQLVEAAVVSDRLISFG